MTSNVSVVETIEFNAPPHKFGHAPVRKMYDTTATVTDDVIWTPSLGKKFVITGLSIVAAGANDGIVSIYEDSNTNGNRFFRGNVVVANKGSFV